MISKIGSLSLHNNKIAKENTKKKHLFGKAWKELLYLTEYMIYITLLEVDECSVQEHDTTTTSKHQPQIKENRPKLKAKGHRTTISKKNSDTRLKEDKVESRKRKSNILGNGPALKKCLKTIKIGSSSMRFDEASLLEAGIKSYKIEVKCSSNGKSSVLYNKTTHTY